MLKRTVISSLLFGIPFIAILSVLSAGQATPPPQRTPTIKVDVDLVLVNVTVTDRRNRYVQGVEKEHLQIWEDKIEQEITHFSKEDAPMTLGIIVDRSGSMGGDFRAPAPPGRGPIPSTNNLQWAQSSAYSCLRDGGLRSDEYFLMEFSDKPKIVADFTNDMSKLTERLLFLGAGGSTALWDAIYTGIAKLEDARNSRKALLVLTDGMENHSRYSLSQLKDFLREQDVRIYFFNEGVDQLAELTGGRVFIGSSPCQQLKADLRNQYVIGYRPTNRAADGNWRAISVKIDRKAFPREIDPIVRTRAGYYANSDPGSATGK